MEIVYKGNCYHLDDILMDKFCPSDLIEPGTAPLLLEPQRNALCLDKDFNPAAASGALTQVLYNFCTSPSLNIVEHIVLAVNSV